MECLVELEELPLFLVLYLHPCSHTLTPCLSLWTTTSHHLCLNWTFHSSFWSPIDHSACGSILCEESLGQVCILLNAAWHARQPLHAVRTTDSHRYLLMTPWCLASPDVHILSIYKIQILCNAIFLSLRYHPQQHANLYYSIRKNKVQT